VVVIRAKVKVFSRTFSSINVGVQGVLMEVLVEEVKNLTKLLLVRNLLGSLMAIFIIHTFMDPVVEIMMETLEHQEVASSTYTAHSKSTCRIPTYPQMVVKPT